MKKRSFTCASSIEPGDLRFLSSADRIGWMAGWPPQIQRRFAPTTSKLLSSALPSVTQLLATSYPYLFPQPHLARHKASARRVRSIFPSDTTPTKHQTEIHPSNPNPNPNPTFPHPFHPHHNINNHDQIHLNCFHSSLVGWRIVRLSTIGAFYRS